jgi:hypothetical protein
MTKFRGFHPYPGEHPNKKFLKTSAAQSRLPFPSAHSILKVIPLWATGTSCPPKTSHPYLLKCSCMEQTEDGHLTGFAQAVLHAALQMKG